MGNEKNRMFNSGKRSARANQAPSINRYDNIGIQLRPSAPNHFGAVTGMERKSQIPRMRIEPPSNAEGRSGIGNRSELLNSPALPTQTSGLRGVSRRGSGRGNPFTTGVTNFIRRFGGR